MSISSLQESMSRKAASMAAVAKRMKNPSDIQSVQQQLIAGVQNGSIEPYVGIPLIQDLTKKLTEAKMAMMNDGPQSNMPVADQVIAQAQGIDNLTSNLPVEYADGGIISFDTGGLTPAETEAELERAGREARSQNYTNPTLDEDKFSRIKTFADEYRKLLPEKDPRLTAYEKSIIKTPEQLEARKNEDLNMALVQFGLGLAGSKSPRFLGGLSEASEKTLPSLQTALSSRRTAEDAQLKMQADMARADRAEGIAALTGGLGLYNKDEDRIGNIELAKAQQKEKTPTDLMNFVNNYEEAARAKDDKRPSSVIRDEAFKNAPQVMVRQEQTASVANTAGSAQALTAQQIKGLAIDKATDNFSKALANTSDPIRKEVNRLRRLDAENMKIGNPTNLQLEFRNKTIEEDANSMMLPSQQSKSFPKTNLNALPEGAVKIGTSGGKIVYQTPDGKQFIQN